MSKNCLFCKIVKGEIPAAKVFESETVLGFKDINPSAPIHVLFISKTHTNDISELSIDPTALSDLFSSLTEYATTIPELKDGYRLIINKGPRGGQSVFHTHIHLLGGKQMQGF